MTHKMQHYNAPADETVDVDKAAIQLLKDPVTQLYTGQALVTMKSAAQACWVKDDLNDMIFCLGYGPRPLEAAVAKSGKLFFCFMSCQQWSICFCCLNLAYMVYKQAILHSVLLCPVVSYLSLSCKCAADNLTCDCCTAQLCFAEDSSCSTDCGFCLETRSSYICKERACDKALHA